MSEASSHGVRQQERELEAARNAGSASEARRRIIDMMPPLGTFDDDPGGPWLGPNQPDERPADQTIQERPGWKGLSEPQKELLRDELRRQVETFTVRRIVPDPLRDVLTRDDPALD